MLKENESHDERRHSENNSLLYNFEEDFTTPPDQTYQYILDDAKYIDNGTLNIVANQNQTTVKEFRRSNEDLGDVVASMKEELDHVNPADSVDEGLKNEVVRAKAIFRSSGNVTSREQRAKIIASKRDTTTSLMKRDKRDNAAYAIDYTKQEDYLRSSTLKASTNKGWSPKRFKRYPRLVLLIFTYNIH